MARDEHGNRGRDDRYGQDMPAGRDGSTDRDPYGGALYGRAREESARRYGSSGGERDVGYGADSPGERERYEQWRAAQQREARDLEAYERSYGRRYDAEETSGRAGFGGGM